MPEQNKDDGNTLWKTLQSNNPTVTNASYGVAAASALPVLTKMIREGAGEVRAHAVGRDVLAKAALGTTETTKPSPRVPKIRVNPSVNRQAIRTEIANRKVLAEKQSDLAGRLAESRSRWSNPSASAEDIQRRSGRQPVKPETSSDVLEKKAGRYQKNISSKFGDVSKSDEGKSTPPLGAYETTGHIGRTELARKQLAKYEEQLKAATSNREYSKIVMKMNTDPVLRPILTPRGGAGMRLTLGGLRKNVSDPSKRKQPMPSKISSAGKSLGKGLLGVGTTWIAGKGLEFYGRKYAESKVDATAPTPSEPTGLENNTKDINEITRIYNYNEKTGAFENNQDRRNWFASISNKYRLNGADQTFLKKHLGLSFK
jgi:hypothetical protein